MKLLCRVLKVSVSGDYLWRKRLTVAPKLKRKSLAEVVKNCYFENRRRGGTRRIRAVLQNSGIKIGRFRIRRLMREQNLKAVQPKSFKPRTTDSRGVKAAPNILATVNLTECAAGQVMIGDITYIALRNGSWCYLAIWQDKVTRCIVGWGLRDTVTAELVMSVLEKASGKGLVKAGAIVHADRGRQYASNGFWELVRTNCFRQSMSWQGNW